MRQGYLEHLPFGPDTIPRASKKTIRLLEAEEFDRLRLSCCPTGESNEPQDWATARNRAILWVLLDTGIRVSELCELRLGDVDREQGQLRIRGKGCKERQIAFSPHGRHQMLDYLDQHRCKGVSSAGGRARTDYLFLTERSLPLTKNALTLVFARLQNRAGIPGKRVSPSLLRDTFAVRYLQAGGEPVALQELLGLQERTPVKRYEYLSEQVREEQKQKERSADHRS